MDNIKTPNMEVTGLDELSKKLDRLQAKDSQMEEQIVKIIREAIKAARSMVTQDAKGAVGNDPRHAYKAVRSMVYKRILGGEPSATTHATPTRLCARWCISASSAATSPSFRSARLAAARADTSHRAPCGQGSEAATVCHAPHAHSK